MLMSLNMGGGKSFAFMVDDVMPYVEKGHENLTKNATLKYVAHAEPALLSSYLPSNGYVHAKVPLCLLVQHLSLRNIRVLAKHHGIKLSSCCAKNTADRSSACASARANVPASSKKSAVILDHDCPPPSSLVLEDDLPNPELLAEFPPAPLTAGLTEQVISDFCKASSPSVTEECEMQPLKRVKGLTNILCAEGVMKLERKLAMEKVREYRGPILDLSCTQACQNCWTSLLRGVVLNNALSNGFWIGPVPDVLKNLNWVEQLLIAKVRRSLCYAHVSSSGLKKMNAHLIAFESPVQRVYEMLPPSRAELDDVLAVLFTGPCEPTGDDLKRTPLLVHRKAVKDALEWLKLNHITYSDVEISYDRLNEYPEHEPPVSIIYRKSAEEMQTVDPAMFKVDGETGVDDGECPFVVHGLTGEQMSAKTRDELKGLALQHW
ncbi:hypothetical protein DXG01_006440 [Tephrocybe rancida]|nr:hypothetical protein DXG01_006440 [Tephrocybe rancida]